MTAATDFSLTETRDVRNPTGLVVALALVVAVGFAPGAFVSSVLVAGVLVLDAVVSFVDEVARVGSAAFCAGSVGEAPACVSTARLDDELETAGTAGARAFVSESAFAA